jgi:tetratricopeptide (TPR) repeat protein
VPEPEQATAWIELADCAAPAFDIDAAIEQLSAEIRDFTAAGENRNAAMACVRLGDLYGNALYNLTAARAWFSRATRLVAGEPPCIEQGWVALAAMGCDVDDPAELLERAELALELSRKFGDVNLEMKALADSGLAHVQSGDVGTGMALLDEALALACGPVDDVGAAGRSICSFFTACYFAADFDRAETWADTLRRRGLLGKSAGAPVFLSNHCDSVQATALCELGRWGDAEAVLTQAIEDFAVAMQARSWHPEIALAELRIRQGRLAEAEMLLLGKDGHFQALLPATCLHLARGDYELARATAIRGLRAIGDDRLRATELLAALVDTELGAGDVAAAEAACADLLSRSGEIDVPGVRARVAAARARVLATRGDPIAAISTLETALDALPLAGASLHRGSLLLQVARLHESVGNHAAAKVEGGRAAAAFASLDVVLSPEDLAFFDRLGVASAEPAGRPSQATAELRRDDRGWLATCGQARARLTDSKGLQYLAELLRTPGVERHSLDLVDRVEGAAPADLDVDRRRLGDAGELIDSQARRAYRHRIEALRGDIDDALAGGAHDKAEVLQEELDLLVSQLAEAFGLGGRARRASSVAERARLNVTRALRTAVARVDDALPEAGAALGQRIRTGLYCAYEPQASDEVRWIVHPNVNGISPG